MRIAPLYLALALILLWLPQALLLGRRRRHELRNPARSVLVTLPALLASPWSWLELARAAGGAWVLFHLAFAVPPPNSPPPTPAVILLGLGIQLGSILVGVWGQTMLTGSRRLRIAPLFYLLGLTAILAPWQLSVFGIVLGFALTGMLRRWRLVFWLMPFSLFAIAGIFRLFAIPGLLSAALYLIPALLGVRPERPLAWIFAPSRAWNIGSDDPRRHHGRRRSHASRAGALRPTVPGGATAPAHPRN